MCGSSRIWSSGSFTLRVTRSLTPLLSFCFVCQKLLQLLYSGTFSSSASNKMEPRTRVRPLEGSHCRYTFRGHLNLTFLNVLWRHVALTLHLLSLSVFFVKSSMFMKGRAKMENIAYILITTKSKHTEV